MVLFVIHVLTTCVNFNNQFLKTSPKQDRGARDINPAQIFRGLYDIAHVVQLLQGRTGLPEKVEDFFSEGVDAFFPKR